MLIDYISVEKLPNWMVWLDWCIYAYRFPLFVCMFIGIVFWILWCLYKQGYPAVG
jgi:hypothetical protein